MLFATLIMQNEKDYRSAKMVIHELKIIEGNRFEGRTLLPIVDGFKTKYNLQKLVVVADAGSVSSNKIELLKPSNTNFLLE